MQHILIPTDFTIRSLNVIHAVVSHNDQEEIKISLFHMLDNGNDITQLFRSMRNKHMDMVPDEFHEACQVLQNRYKSIIKTIKIEFGFGTTSKYLANLLEGLKVDKIIVSPNLLTYTNRKSVDPLPLFKKAGAQVTTLQIDNPIVISHNEVGVSNILPTRELGISKIGENYVVAK